MVDLKKVLYQCEFMKVQAGLRVCKRILSPFKIQGPAEVRPA